MKYRDEEYEYERRKREMEQRRRVRPDAEMTSQRRKNSSAQRGTGTSQQYQNVRRSASVGQAAGTRRSSTAQNPSAGRRGSSPAQTERARRAPQAEPIYSTRRTTASQGSPVRRRAVDPYDRGYADMASRKRQRPVRPTEDLSERVNTKEKKTISPKLKKKRRIRKILFAVEGVLLVVVLAALFVLSKWDLIQKASFGKKDIHVNDLSSNVVESMSGYRNIAIFGKDEEGNHSDVIMIASINNKTKEIKLVSVLRDTFWNTPDPGGKDRNGDENKYSKANNAYHTGGELNALKALNKNLDLNITEYVTVNWTAVSLAVDYLDGIDIDVPESMMGEINGYITDTVKGAKRGTTQLTSSGYQHLDGVQTVAFCRIRHNNGGDDGRAARQRQVVGLLLEQAKTMKMSTMMTAIDDIFPHISTDLTLADIVSLGSNVSDYSLVGNVAFPYHQVDAYITNTSGTPMSAKVPLGLAEDVAQLHQELFGDNEYVPSETVMQISNKIEALTGYSADDRKN